MIPVEIVNTSCDPFEIIAQGEISKEELDKMGFNYALGPDGVFRISNRAWEYMTSEAKKSFLLKFKCVSN